MLLPLLRKDPYHADAHAVIQRALETQPGARGSYAYSNLGIAFLGQLLAIRAGAPYEQLITERLLSPLGMEATSIPISPDRLARDAPRGTNAHGQPNAPWTMRGQAPAGGIRSSAAEMSCWVRSVQDGTNPGAAGLEAVDEEGKIGITWRLLPAADGGTIIMHNGETGGFSSFTGYHRETGRGIVLLSATANSQQLSELGLGILDGAPLPQGTEAAA